MWSKTQCFISVGKSRNTRQKCLGFCFMKLSEMWYFIAFGTTVCCFPAPLLMSQHIQPYTTWQASNFGILCNTKFPRRRVGWLRRKKRSHIVGLKTSSATTKAGCIAVLMTTRSEAWEMCGGFCSPWRSYRTVGSHKILLILQQLQSAASWMWDFFGGLHRPCGAQCEPITAFCWQLGPAPIICLRSSQLKELACPIGSSLFLGQPWPFPARMDVSCSALISSWRGLAYFASACHGVNTKCGLQAQSRNVCVCWSGGSQASSVTGLDIGTVVWEQNLACWGWFS